MKLLTVFAIFAIFLTLPACGMVATDASKGTTRTMWLGGRIAASASPGAGSEVTGDMERSLRDGIVGAVTAYAMNQWAGVLNKETAADSQNLKTVSEASTERRAIKSAETIKLDEGKTARKALDILP